MPFRGYIGTFAKAKIQSQWQFVPEKVRMQEMSYAKLQKWIINVNKGNCPIKFDAHFVQSIVFQLRVWLYVAWLLSLLLFFCVTHTDCDASKCSNKLTIAERTADYMLLHDHHHTTCTQFLFRLSNFNVVSSSIDFVLAAALLLLWFYRTTHRVLLSCDPWCEWVNCRRQNIYQISYTSSLFELFTPIHVIWTINLTFIQILLARVLLSPTTNLNTNKDSFMVCASINLKLSCLIVM